MPILPELDDEEGWNCATWMRDLRQDYSSLMENVLDLSHVPFTHHNTQDKRKNAVPNEFDAQTMGKVGFNGLWLRPKDRVTAQQTIFVAPGYAA